MSETKHTSAPWEIDDKNLRVHIVSTGARRGSDELLTYPPPVAQVFPIRRDKHGEREANARLIAAAPDLLFACEQAEKFIEFLKLLNQSDEIDEATCLHGLLTEAIAKARGEREEEAS